MRLILDTNLWISFLINSKFENMDEILFNRNCKLLFSQELLEEFIAVVKRPKIRKYISRVEFEDLLDTIDEVAEFINVTSEMSV